MAKSLLLKGVLITALVLVLVYVFSASYFLALIIVATLGIFGEIIHLPENMPGEADNPDGEGLHPAKAILIGGVIVVALVVLGEVFPVLYALGVSPNG
tara:strand:- start:42 stop:335 length:294 start_codon:yes stop_codon:yes gene_type:complete